MSKYIVSSGFSWQTNDMGIQSRGTNVKPVSEENLKEGADLFGGYSSEHSQATVKSFKDGVLVFDFQGEEITLTPGHTWHSPNFGEPNPYVHESYSYMVSVKEELNPAMEKEYANRILPILKKMRKNAAEEWHPVWKNIPLAKELLDIIQNKIPISGKYVDATGIVFLCDCIFLEDLLEEREVPRLCLEFLQLRKLAVAAQKETDDKYDPEFVLGVQEAEKIQNRLDLYIDPNVSTDWWIEYVHAHLKFDPVERTPEYEAVIYEVEKECDRRLKHEPRGMGFCFSYWSVKRAVLAQYGIEWDSPSRMNPRVMFD